MISNDTDHGVTHLAGKPSVQDPLSCLSKRWDADALAAFYNVSVGDDPTVAVDEKTSPRSDNITGLSMRRGSTKDKRECRQARAKS